MDYGCFLNARPSYSNTVVNQYTKLTEMGDWRAFHPLKNCYENSLLLYSAASTYVQVLSWMTEMDSQSLFGYL